MEGVRQQQIKNELDKRGAGQEEHSPRCVPDNLDEVLVTGSVQALEGARRTHGTEFSSSRYDQYSCAQEEHKALWHQLNPRGRAIVEMTK
jgi:hypothetical protein